MSAGAGLPPVGHYVELQVMEVLPEKRNSPLRRCSPVITLHTDLCKRPLDFQSDWEFSEGKLGFVVTTHVTPTCHYRKPTIGALFTLI